MKKSSRDRRVFRRLERRLQPFPLILIPDKERWQNLAQAMDYIDLSVARSIVQKVNSTAIDTTKIQVAFHKVNEAFNNLSKVNIKC